MFYVIPQIAHLLHMASRSVRLQGPPSTLTISATSDDKYVMVFDGALCSQQRAASALESDV